MANIVEILIEGKDLSAQAIEKARANLEGLEKQGTSALGQLEKLGTLAIGAGIAAGVGGIMASVHAYSELGDEVLRLQRVTGQSAQDTSRLIFAAKETGVEYDNLSRAMRLFSRNMTLVQEQEAGMATKTSTNQKVLESLGITVLDASGKIRPMSQLLGELADKFKAMPDGPTKTGLAMQIFGRGGMQMLPFLNEGSAGIARLNEEADKLGVTMSQKDVDSAHEFEIANRQLSEAVKGVELGVARGILPALTGLARAFSESTQSGAKFMDFMQGAALGLAALWTDAMIIVSNIILSVLEKILNSWRDMLSKLTGDVKVLGRNINPFAGMDTSHISLGRQELVDPMFALKKMFPDITKPMEDLGKASGEAGNDLGAFADKTKSAADVMSEGEKLLKDAQTELFAKPTRERAQADLKLDQLQGALDSLKDKFQPTLDGFDALKTGLDDSKAKLDDWGENISAQKDKLADLIQKADDQIKNIQAMQSTESAKTALAEDKTGSTKRAYDAQVKAAEQQKAQLEAQGKGLDKQEKERQRQLKELEEQGKMIDRQKAQVEQQIKLAERQVASQQSLVKADDQKQKIMKDELTLADQNLLTSKQRDATYAQLLNDTKNITGRIGETSEALGKSLLPSIEQVHQIATKSGDILQAIRDVTDKQDKATKSLDKLTTAANNATTALNNVEPPAGQGKVVSGKGTSNKPLSQPLAPSVGQAMRGVGFALG